MNVLHGIPISPGYARGRAFIYTAHVRSPAPRYHIDASRVPGEHDRLHRALEHACGELQDLQKRVLAELGQAESDIFGAHLALLRDKHFIDNVKKRIGRNLVNVEHALHEEIEDLANLLAEVENEYLRERARDVYDVRQRILKHLGYGAEKLLSSIPPDAVLVARELTPTDTLDLDRSHVAAIVTARGSETGHAAILARSLGIPAVSGIEGVVSTIERGAEVLVDGNAGVVTLTPARSQVDEFAADKRRYNHDSAAALSEKNLPCRTADGVPVALMANIGRPDEAVEARRGGLDGVGLFRTEYLYLQAGQPPDLDTQSTAYGRTAETLDGLPLTIRTLDLGGDKKPKFMSAAFENNPNLGVRGLRFSLLEPDLLRTQLRAIIRTAARHPNVGVLFPMVLGVDDLRRALDHLNTVIEDEQPGFGVSAGAMVETPSCLFQLHEILREVDFVSLGTNDLVQFMLAADRNAPALVGAASVVHPAVVRALRMVAEVAAETGTPVCACGEAAGDPRIACLMTGLGIRRLSMSPARAARVRRAIRARGAAELEDLARELAGCASEEQGRSLLDERLGTKHESATP